MCVMGLPSVCLTVLKLNPKESIENQALQLELNEALGDDKPKDEMVNELKSKVQSRNALRSLQTSKLISFRLIR